MPVYTPKKLYTGQPGTTATTLYTAPASTYTLVKNIILCNVTTSDAKVSVSFVPSGGSAGVTNRIMADLVVKANDTVAMDLSGFLATGDFISAVQVTSGAITLHVTGVEVT